MLDIAYTIVHLQGAACDANGVITPQAKEEVLERVSEYFPPELLNRLDSMQVFNKLSRKSILDVVSLRLKDVADRLRNRRITLDVDDTALQWLAQQGYSEVYGARAIARVVRTDVLFPMAQKLLKGTIRWGCLLRFSSFVGLMCIALSFQGWRHYCYPRIS